MFGLDGEGVVRRARELAAEAAGRLDLPVDADDTRLEQAATRLVEQLARDRKLKRPLRDPRIREVVAALATWEIVVATVGQQQAEARYAELRGLEVPASTSQPPEAPAAAGPSWHLPSTAPADPPGRIRRRPRQHADVALSEEQTAGGLGEAVSAEPVTEDDPMHADGFDHYVWLEEWLEFAIGGDALQQLESRLAAHPDVDAAVHQDREVLYVAAPSLHPDDVRALLLELIAPHFDAAWESKLGQG